MVTEKNKTKTILLWILIRSRLCPFRAKAQT